ncbi:hypothetical protein HMI54_006345 [Coelomomyces lativittatus]|nr:hypothetical protein HMI55_002111 [Coelomomyces lativittatus]KAJ1505067.1 hypothetical protein HMI54_006345 [Coelomomyces lativittatus]
MQQLITLGGDARVKIWDATFMQVTSDVPLKYADETVCMGIDIQRQLVSIGSQEYISLFDLRSNQFVHHFESADDGWGVRSLAHNAHILASGGGMGRLAFYDLRAMAYLPIGEKNQGFLEIQSEGYLNRDPTYMSHFHGTVVKHAIYTLSYCEDHCRLFTGGGPLQLGLCGSYMAVW